MAAKAFFSRIDLVNSGTVKDINFAPKNVLNTVHYLTSKTLFSLSITDPCFLSLPFSYKCHNFIFWVSSK